MSVGFFNGFDTVFGNIFNGAADNSILFSALLIIFIILIIANIAVTIGYIFQSMGFYAMARRRGIKSPGLAWVPVAALWIIGSLADQYDRKAAGSDMKLRKKMLGLNIASVVLLFIICVLFCIPATLAAGGSLYENAYGGALAINIALVVFALAMSVVSVLQSVYSFIAFYKIYRSCKPSSAVALLILSIFFSVVAWFAIFALRRRDEGFEQIRKRELSSQNAQS